VRVADEPDPAARDRFVRLLTGVTTIPAGQDRKASSADQDAGVAGSRAAAMAALSGLSPGRRAMKPLIAVAVCVALIAGFLAWRSRPRVAGVTPAASMSAPSSLATALGAGSAATGGASPATQLIVVAVQGRVRHPGLVELPPGSRVADAIAAAGGALPGTDLSYVNLAQKVADGQLIVIAKSGPMGGSGGAGPPPGGMAPGRPLNLNAATASDLDALPGIGPALAARIIAYRAQHGAFRSIDELRSVPGIGDAKFAEIKDLVTV
jgi:competence protein ComEA